MKPFHSKLKADGKNVHTTESAIIKAECASPEMAAYVAKSCNAHETLVAAMRTIIELAANAPGRDVFAKIATEALTDAEAV
jgi:hypothetical protein